MGKAMMATRSKLAIILPLACMLRAVDGNSASCQTWKDGVMISPAVDCGMARYNFAQTPQFVSLCATVETGTKSSSSCDAAFACASPAPYIGGNVLGGKVILDGECY